MIISKLGLLKDKKHIQSKITFKEQLQWRHLSDIDLSTGGGQEEMLRVIKMIIN
jgi:hypothetical protein